MSRRQLRGFELQREFRARAWIAALVAGAVAFTGCAGSDPAPSPAPEIADAASSPDVPSSWLARAQETIAAREYEASESRHALQAPNRRHDLRTWFEPTGVRIADRMDEQRTLVDLKLASVGRSASETPVAAGAVTHEGARVEIHRAGITEWYDNSPAGLEQGFTLVERPQGEGPLIVALSVDAAEAGLRGEDVVLQAASGRKLGYGELVAVDATGRALAAHFEVPRPDRIRLVIDDREAAYPLTIDPVLTGLFDLQLESDQQLAALGTSVAGAGDVNGDGYADVIVGAPDYDAGETDEGAAFLFLGGPTGIANGHVSNAQTVLQSNQASAFFGQSVAGAGDVNGDGYADVIVGADAYDAGQTDEGAAFVFLGSATGIADGSPATADAQLESDQTSAHLGVSVAGAGDVNGDGYADVIVGSPYYSDPLTQEGAAFVFLGSAAGIPDGSPASADDQIESNHPGGSLGGSVASAGDVNGDGYDDVIVGAPGYDGTQTDEGAAFLFLGSAAGITGVSPSTSFAQFVSHQEFGQMGISVAGAGDVNGDGYADIVVGARGYDGDQPGSGAAFVFLGSAAGIPDGDPATADGVLSVNQSNVQFGYSVAGAGDVNADGYADVIVGAQNYQFSQSQEGVAYIYLGSATGITDASSREVLPVIRSQQASAHLGSSVAGAGDINGDGYADVIVGSPYYSDPLTQEGAAFVLLGGAYGVCFGSCGPPQAAAEIKSKEAGAELGISVASAGDVNGDGYDDVIIGASYYDLGLNNQGAAFVFLGGPGAVSDGNPISAATRLQSNQVAAYFGTSVAGAGDVNGDGYDDIIIGAPYFDSPETNEGAAFLYLGSASGIADGSPATADARIESNQTNGFLGISVAGAGDVNGDGYADVIIGDHVYDDGETDEGAAFVFLGSAVGIADGSPATADTRLESNQASALFGWSVAGAGDVNGDGYADVIVGAIQYAAGESGEGAAFVFLGSAAGIADGSPATADTQLESNQANAHFGWSVAGAGDVNADGDADVIVGAPGMDLGETDEGAAFVFLGDPAGIADGSPATALAQLESNEASVQLGISVAGVGDVNGDGYADVIVGAPYYFGIVAGQNGGGAFVFYGGSLQSTGGTTKVHNTADNIFQSIQPNSRFGISVAGAGDVNGDGYADVIVGSPYYSDPLTQEGAALVFLGNRGHGGRSDLPRQRRGDASGVPVSAWGRSESNDGFEVEITAHHPRGSGLVKLEAEACPVNVAFGDSACMVQTSPSWTAVDGVTPEVGLAETFSGLDADTLYRWRVRVLQAPTGATQPGITPPPNPEHGPWRRLDAQSREADIRVVPEPAASSMCLAGALLLAGLAHTRRRTSVL